MEETISRRGLLFFFLIKITAKDFFFHTLISCAYIIKVVYTSNERFFYCSWEFMMVIITAKSDFIEYFKQNDIFLNNILNDKIST